MVNLANGGQAVGANGKGMLQKCDGPACPACGCQDTRRYAGRRRWTGQEYVQFVCQHCGKVFYPEDRWQEKSAEQEKTPEPEISPGGAVIYRPVRCPKCNSLKVKVTSTRRPVRHHKCEDCGERFKSVEAPSS